MNAKLKTEQKISVFMQKKISLNGAEVSGDLSLKRSQKD